MSSANPTWSRKLQQFPRADLSSLVKAALDAIRAVGHRELVRFAGHRQWFEPIERVAA